MSAASVVTLIKGVERIISLRQGAGVVEIRNAVAPRLSVISLGVQGPVGALAEDVLQRTLQAEANSRIALSKAVESEAALSALFDGMRASFIHHAGAISAQGG